MIERVSPRKLNKDTDERSLNPDEARDALNISVGLDSKGNAGVVKPVDGNVPSALSDELASQNGVNTVIGSVADEETGVVYFFCYNSLQKHSVWAYSSKTDTYRLIFTHSSLNFEPDGFVKGDIVRVRKRPEALPLEVTTGQGGSGGAVDFEEEQVIEFESDALVVNLSFFIRRDLTVFTENANGIISRDTFLNVFNGTDFRIRISGTDNQGGNLVLFPSEQAAEGNTGGTFEREEFSQVGLSGSNGRALWQVDDVWVDASKFSGSAEIKVDIDFLGQYDCHAWQNTQTASIGERLSIETLTLSPSDFSSGNFSSSGSDGTTDPCLGAPNKNLTTLTVNDVFANNILGGAHTNPNVSAYHMLRAQKRLVQYDVDSNGDVVSSGLSDSVLRDRSVRVKTKVSLPEGMQEYCSNVVSLAEEFGENGGGGEIWGTTDGPDPANRQARADDGGSSPTGNVYGLAWDAIMGAFRLVYFQDIYIETIETNPLNPDLGGQREWADVYSETISAVNAFPFPVSGVQTNNTLAYKQITPDPLAVKGYTIRNSGSFTDGSFVDKVGYVKVANNEFQAINDSNLNLIETVRNHYTNDVVALGDIINGDGKSNVVIVTLPELHPAALKSVFTSLDTSAWGDESKRKVFYMDHVGYSSSVAFSQYRGNKSSLAIEMKEAALEGLQPFGNNFYNYTFSIPYLSYVAGLSGLTYNLGVPLSYAMSPVEDFRRHMIHNWYWPGIRISPNSAPQTLTLPLSDNVESPGALNTFPSTAQTRAWERQSDFDESSVLISNNVDDWAAIDVDSTEINTLSETFNFYWGNGSSVLLSNGQTWDGWTRVLSIPTVRLLGEDYEASQGQLLSPNDDTQNGYIEYGPVNQTGDLIPFAPGLNSSGGSGAVDSPPPPRDIPDPTVVNNDGGALEESADDATNGGGVDGPTRPPEDSEPTRPTETSSISSELTKKTITKKY